MTIYCTLLVENFAGFTPRTVMHTYQNQIYTQDSARWLIELN